MNTSWKHFFLRKQQDEKSNLCCFYCKKDGLRIHTSDMAIKATVDHFYPTYFGGQNRHKNFVVACYDCNQRKGSKHPIAFIKEMSAL